MSTLITPGCSSKPPLSKPLRDSAEASRETCADNDFCDYENRKDITVVVKEMEDLLHGAFLQVLTLADHKLDHDVLKQTHEDIWNAYSMWGKLLMECGIGPKPPQPPQPKHCEDLCGNHRHGINKLPWRPSTSKTSSALHRGPIPRNNRRMPKDEPRSLNTRPPLRRFRQVIARTPSSDTTSMRPPMSRR